MRICIVEDSRAIAALLESLVKRIIRNHIEICHFSSAEELLEFVQRSEENRADVLLVDVGLPGMSGIELCRHLRQQAAGNSEYIPYIIIITGLRDPDSIAHAIEAGANDYIQKPVNSKVLDIRLCLALKLIEQAHFSEESDYFRSMALYANHHARVPLTVCDATMQGAILKILYSNKAMDALMGTSRDVLVGQSLAELQDWHGDFSKTVRSQLSAGNSFRGTLVSNSAHWNSLHIQTGIHPVESDNGVTHFYIIQEPCA